MATKNTKKKSTSINLLDHALSIEGPEPMAVDVGPVEIILRRSHTGQQVIDWQKAEAEREADAADVLGNKDTSEEKKVELIRALMRNYSRNLLRALCVEDTPEETIAEAAELIADLPASSRSTVFRTVGQIAGVVDEEGNPFPSAPSSKTKSSIAK